MRQRITQWERRAVRSPIPGHPIPGAFQVLQSPRSIQGLQGCFPVSGSRETTEILLTGGSFYLSGRLTVPPASMVILGILRREEMVAVGWVPTLLML